MLHSGERQVAPDISGIRHDHVARYRWADTQLPRNSKILDIGCGVGYGAFILAEAGHTITAIDIDLQAIEYAKQHYAHQGITFTCRKAEWTKDPVETYDAITCFEVIEHVTDPDVMLRSASRLAPILLASVPNERVFPFGKGYAFHFRHYTDEDFRCLLRDTNFQEPEWWGQADTDSNVERDVEGRTLVVRAMRSGLRLKSIPPLPTPKQLAPEHVVILGLGPSLEMYVDRVKRFGSRKAFADEVWGINAVGDVIQCDRIFHMDDLRIQEARAQALPQSNIANMVKWLRTHPGPIYTSQLVSGYPGLVEFPFEEVINSTGFAYFNGTPPYAVAYAIHLGVKRISFFGADYTYANSHFAERGRACLEFWIGMAVAKGIEIWVPDKSSLLDACEPDNEFYGYDAVNVNMVKRENGSTQITFEPRDTLPTAAEIEDRYNHDTRVRKK